MKKIIVLLLSVVLTFSLAGGASALTGIDGYEFKVPRVVIKTENGNGTKLLKADGYVDAEVTITDTDGTTLESGASFKVRGNSTAFNSIPKKAFQIKYPNKKDVLGMGKAKKWVLLANAFDPTLMRNYNAFTLAQQLGLEYTSQQRIVELWLDDSYRGMYQLIEPVGDGKDRVDIDVDGNGGKKDFIIEYEATRNEDDVSYFKVGDLRFAMKEPDEPSDEQLEYYSGVMTDIINTIKNGTMREIGQKIDIQSFVKFYVLNEFIKTVDFGFSSVFFYYKDNILYAGPAWDYDLSAGNSNENYSSEAKKAHYPEGMYAYTKNIYKILCGYDWFNYLVKAEYENNRGIFSNVAGESGLIDSFLADYSEIIDKNFSLTGFKVSAYYVNVMSRPLSTYEENLAFYRNWMYDRDIWLADYYSSIYYYLKGDSDGDSDISIADVSMIQMLLACIVSDDDGMITKRSALVDETLSISDATRIQQYLANMDVDYRINEAVLLTET